MNYRLFIISGKGGTGKTTLSFALSKLLLERGKKVQYTAFDHEVDYSALDELGIPYFETTVEKSCEKYIGLKLKSETIAKWIMKTPFFSALFSILPSLGSMILLGHYIKELENDPDLVIVLDSPATGHAKSMIEATHNFKEIFKAGVLVHDIHRMHDFLHKKEHVKSFICSLPTEMSLQEAGELKSFMMQKNLTNTSIILNNYIKSPNSNMSFINGKISSETEIIDHFTKSSEISQRIPKIFSHQTKLVVMRVKETLEKLI